ncbi:MAG: hypothetical protein ACHQUC_04320 [Chlamydiales bacterium]
MSREQKVYEAYEETERKLKEFSITSEKIDRECKSLLQDLSLTPQQLKEYMENPDNFTPALWESLQNEKKKMEEMLKLQMSVVQDPKKTKKKYADRGRIKQNWLFVR